MVGTIVSMVYGEDSRKAAGALIWHTAGLTIGGALLGVALHFATLPLTTWINAGQASVLVGSFALVYALHEFQLATIPYPQLRRQVPRGWSRIMRPWAFSFFYGVLLGLAFVTHVWVATLVPVVAFAALARSVGASVILLMLYGLGRAVPLWYLERRSRDAGWRSATDALDHVHSKKARVHPANGAALAFSAGLFLIAGLAPGPS